MSVIGTLLVLGILIALTGSIARRIELAADAAKKVSSGDLTLKIESAGGDETGVLLRSIDSMVKALRAGAHLEQIKSLNEKMQAIEGEADKLIIELIRNLVNGKHDPIKVIVVKDLYEMLEKIIDRCRDATIAFPCCSARNSASGTPSSCRGSHT